MDNNIIRRDNLFNHYFNYFDIPLLRECQFMKTDIYEVGNRYTIEIDLPGLKKENIIINYDSGYITVEANRKENVVNFDKYVRKERFTSNIKRSFFIGDKKESDIKANYKDGVLVITFPKENINKKIDKNIAIN